MTKDGTVGTLILLYIAVAFVVYGFSVKSMFASSVVSAAPLVLSIPIAAFWPASGLIWFGSWLA